MVKDEKDVLSKDSSEGVDDDKGTEEEDDAANVETHSSTSPKVEEDQPEKGLVRGKEVACSGQGKKGQPEFDALIFMCNSFTKTDCFKYGVFGLTEGKRHIVEQVRQGMRLFLFDIEMKLLYGVFRAASRGGFKLEPDAYQESVLQFPWQVRFIVYKECTPLPESVFKEAIKENYFAEKKFNIELTGQQAQKLMKLFRPAPNGRKIFPSFPKSLPKARGPARERSPPKWEKAALKGSEEPKAWDRSPQRHVRAEPKVSTPDKVLQENQTALPQAADDMGLGVSSSVQFSHEARAWQDDAPPLLSPVRANTGILEPLTSSAGPLLTHTSAYRADFNAGFLRSGLQESHFGPLKLSSGMTDPVLPTGSLTAQGMFTSDILHKPDPYGLNLDHYKPDPYRLDLERYKPDPYRLDLDMRYKPDPYNLSVRSPSVYDYLQGNAITNPASHEVASLYRPPQLPPPPLPNVQGGMLGRTYGYDPPTVDGLVSYTSSVLGKRSYQATHLGGPGPGAFSTLPPPRDEFVSNYLRQPPYEEAPSVRGSVQYSGAAPPAYGASSFHYNGTAPLPQPNISSSFQYNGTGRPYSRGLW